MTSAPRRIASRVRVAASSGSRSENGASVAVMVSAVRPSVANCSRKLRDAAAIRCPANHRGIGRCRFSCLHFGAYRRSSVRDRASTNGNTFAAGRCVRAVGNRGICADCYRAFTHAWEHFSGPEGKSGGSN